MTLQLVRPGLVNQVLNGGALNVRDSGVLVSQTQPNLTDSGTTVLSVTTDETLPAGKSKSKSNSKPSTPKFISTVNPTPTNSSSNSQPKNPATNSNKNSGDKPVVNPKVKSDRHFRIYVTKDKFFEMDMLPAIKQNLSHPHGLAGQAIPGAPPGVTFTQLQNTANIPIPGGAPVVQSLGINMMTMQFVGAFIGLPRVTTDSSDPYWILQERDKFDCSLHSTGDERDFYDKPLSNPSKNKYPGRGVIDKGDEAWHVAYIFSRDVVAEQKEVQVSIVTQNYLSVRETGVITQFVPMLARNDRVYYKFTLLLTDYYNELHPRVPASYVSEPPRKLSYQSSYIPPF